MNLSNLRSPRGSRSARKRLGRGESSGQGKTAGRGHKGQKSRTGNGKISAFFEGGQIPLSRRLPKFGFKSMNRIERAVINLKDLEAFESGAVVDHEALLKKGLLRSKLEGGFKVLGTGEIKKALTVKAHAFSQSAQAAIEKAGGKVEVVK